MRLAIKNSKEQKKSFDTTLVEKTNEFVDLANVHRSGRVSTTGSYFYGFERIEKLGIAQTPAGKKLMEKAR